MFEKLGLSLFDFLKRNTYKPFSIDLVQDFSRQLLEAVAYMHELELVHTDLKVGARARVPAIEKTFFFDRGGFSIDLVQSFSRQQLLAVADLKVGDLCLGRG